METITQDLISEIANYILEKSLPIENKTVQYSITDIGNALNLSWDLIHDNQTKIKKKLRQFPEVAWVSDSSGFEIKFWNVEKKTNETDLVAFGELNHNTAIEYVSNLLSIKLQKLQDISPEKKYTIGKIVDCIKEVRSLK